MFSSLLMSIVEIQKTKNAEACQPTNGEDAYPQIIISEAMRLHKK